MQRARLAGLSRRDATPRSAEHAGRTVAGHVSLAKLLARQDPGNPSTPWPGQGVDARPSNPDDDRFRHRPLDGWATVADVLTFYQERIANESYLRTAIERRSLLELARKIGYELRPGIAAGTSSRSR